MSWNPSNSYPARESSSRSWSTSSKPLRSYASTSSVPTTRSTSSTGGVLMRRRRDADMRHRLDQGTLEARAVEPGFGELEQVRLGSLPLGLVGVQPAERSRETGRVVGDQRPAQVDEWDPLGADACRHERKPSGHRVQEFELDAGAEAHRV